MKKSNISKIILVYICCFLVIGTIGTSFIHYWPTKSYKIDDTNNPIQVLSYNNIDVMQDCKIENGALIVNGESPKIIYKNINKNVKSIKIEFLNSPDKSNTKFIKWKYDGNYVYDDCLNRFNEFAMDYMCFKTGNKNLSEIQINIEKDNNLFKTIKMYNTDLLPEEITLYPPFWWYLIVLLIDIISSFIFTVVIIKFNLLKKLFNKLATSSRRDYKFIILVANLIVIGLVIELIFSFAFMLANQNDYTFNISRWAFITCAFLIIFLFIRIGKNNNIQIEKIFLVISILSGSMMILCAPLGHNSLDLDSHLKWVVGPSNIKGYSTEAEYNIVFNKENSLPKDNYNENIENAKCLNEQDGFTTRTTSRKLKISHIPGTIIYSLSRFFNIPFTIKYDLVRLTYLLMYSFICYFAIKKLKSKKYLLSCIALFPANIFLASNITYDWWVTSLIFYGFSVFLTAAQSPNTKIKYTTSFAISCPIFFACIVKLIYFPLLFIPLFFNKKMYTNKINRWKNYIVSISFIFLTIIMFLVVTLNATETVGDLRGGNTVNSAEQFTYIFQHPVEYSKVLINYLLDYLSLATACIYTSGLGFFGIAQDFGIFIILAILATIVDKNKYDIYTSRGVIKIANIIIFAITICMIATALYISFTPVGHETINGCQPRYIVPLLFPLLATIGPKKITFNLTEKCKKLIFFLPISIFIFWDIGTLMLTKML